MLRIYKYSSPYEYKDFETHLFNTLRPTFDHPNDRLYIAGEQYRISTINYIGLFNKLLNNLASYTITYGNIDITYAVLENNSSFALVLRPKLQGCVFTLKLKKTSVNDIVLTLPNNSYGKDIINNTITLSGGLNSTHILTAIYENGEYDWLIRSRTEGYGGEIQQVVTTFSQLPTIGNPDIIYYVSDTNMFYYFNGDAYIPTNSNIPSGALVNDITNGVGWNALTNTPQILSGVGNAGDFAIVSVAGTTSIDGTNSWGVKDYIWYDSNSSTWKKIDNQNSVTSSNRIEFIVNTESEFEAAYRAINNNYEGGIIRLGAEIHLTKNHSFSHENIVIECDYNRLYFHGYTITIIGTSCFYNNGYFDGTNDVASDSKFAISDTGIHSTMYLFYSCRFYNFITNANRIFLYITVPGSAHVYLKDCSFNANVNIQSYVALVQLNSPMQYHSFHVYRDISEGVGTSTKLFGVTGNNPSSGFKEFTDGSCTFSNVITPAGIVNILNPLVEKTTPVDADTVRLTDSTLFHVPKKLTWANIKSTLKSYFDTIYTFSLGYTAENEANKSTNIVTDGSSNVKYPGVKAIKDYVDGMVAGLLDYRGAYDASGNVFPSAGGSGSAGAILKGDIWAISVAGILGSVAIQVGDYIIANIDSPGQTNANWDKLNTNVSYVPLNADFTGNTVKSTLVDNDVLAINDSENSYSVKKTLWSTIKSALVAYFDTIFAKLTGAAFTGDVTLNVTNKQWSAANVVTKQEQLIAGASGITKVRDVASWVGTSGVSGILKISLPIAQTAGTNTPVYLKISGHNQVLNTSWIAILAGTPSAGSPGVWGYTSAIVIGAPPFDYVRFGKDGTNFCILLGTTSTVWNAAMVVIDELLVGFTNLTSSLVTGWTITRITAETGLTIDSSPLLDKLASSRPRIIAVSTNTTLNASHADNIIECTGTITITLPNSFDAGFRCDIINVGTGVITIQAATTLQSDGSKNKLATQYTGASVYHRGSNIWLASGKLTV